MLVPEKTVFRELLPRSYLYCFLSEIIIYLYLHIYYVMYVAHLKSSYFLLQESTNPTYKKIYETLQRNPSLYMANNDEGQEKVLREDYAFFMESTSIE